MLYKNSFKHKAAQFFWTRRKFEKNDENRENWTKENLFYNFFKSAKLNKLREEKVWEKTFRKSSVFLH